MNNKKEIPKIETSLEIKIYPDENILSFELESIPYEIICHSKAMLTEALTTLFTLFNKVEFHFCKSNQ